MRQIKAISAVAALAVAASLLMAGSAVSQERNRVQGMVLDEQGNPAEAVWVRIYRGTDEIGAGYTAAGRYEIEFDRGGPLTTIRYDDMRSDAFERRHPAVVSNLSGTEDHNITKVMGAGVGQAYDEQELLELLSAYERLYFVDHAIELEPGTIRRDLYDRYQQNIAMMKHVDPYTEQRLVEVRALYDQE
jgi:hypothetical protein